MHITRNFFIIFLITIFIGSASVPRVFAGSFSLDDEGSGSADTQSFFDDLLVSIGLDGFGLDTDEVKNTLKSTNVMNYKKTTPSVTLTFAPTTPVPGAKITAVASPVGFNSSPKSLYFTWMLKRGYCKPSSYDSDTATEKEKTCDANKDGEITVEDYKIEAMRAIASGEFDWKSADYSQKGDGDGYSATSGGPDQKEKPAHCYIHSYDSGTDIELGELGDDLIMTPLCFHLFPKKWYMDENGNVGVKEDDDGNDLFVGASTESFGVDEERFWHTDPTTQDTSNSGGNDEQNLTGLNKLSFAWTYTAGDKIGVIVEGASVESTTYKDSSYKIMFAMLGNKGTDETLTSNPFDADGNMIFSTKTMDDLNDWAEESMIEPAKGNTDKNQPISLSYSPSNPTVSQSNSDELSVQSSVLNDESSDFTKFAWEVSLKSSSEYDANISGDDGWERISDADLATCTGTKSASSIGLNTLSIKLSCLSSLNQNFKDKKKFYAKVSLRSSENAEGLEKKGLGTIIVPIQSSSTSISVYSTSITGSGANDVTLGNELCNVENGKSVCSVTPNQIVGIKIPVENPSDYDFSWTLNGKRLSTQEIGNNVATFPVLNEKGATYVLKVDYTMKPNVYHKDPDSDKKITLIKNFKVVEPTASIASGDDTSLTPLLLGNYIDLDNKYHPDYSQDSFEALQGKTVKLKPLFNTSFSKANWIIDGTTLTAENASALGASVDDAGILSLKIDKKTGYSYNIGMEAVYDQTLLAKKYLVANEGASSNSFEEKNVTKNIYIAVVDEFSNSTGRAVTSAPKKKVLASLFTGLPAYISFLFRIVITMALILFSTSILFSFFPKQE